MWETRILTHYQWQYKSVQYFVERNLATAFDPAISLLEIYLAEVPVQRHIDTFTKMFKVALFKTSKYWKQPKCPSPELFSKIMVHSCYRILYKYLKTQWSGSVYTLQLFKNTMKWICIYYHGIISITYKQNKYVCKMFGFSQFTLFRKQTCITSENEKQKKL